MRYTDINEIEFLKETIYEFLSPRSSQECSETLFPISQNETKQISLKQPKIITLYILKHLGED